MEAMHGIAMGTTTVLERSTSDAITAKLVLKCSDLDALCSTEPQGHDQGKRTLAMLCLGSAARAGWRMALKAKMSSKKITIFFGDFSADSSDPAIAKIFQQSHVDMVKAAGLVPTVGRSKRQILRLLETLAGQTSFAQLEFVFIGHGEEGTGNWVINEHEVITAEEVQKALEPWQGKDPIKLKTFACHDHLWKNRAWPPNILFCPASTPDKNEGKLRAKKISGKVEHPEFEEYLNNI
ncbi:hypothetical protein QOT17_009750 [Balamuthia mandrillaris]